MEGSPYDAKIYYVNDTIPRGLGAFYHLRDIDKGAVAAFIASDETERWVFPTDAGEYPSTFTVFRGNYTYMKKVFINARLLYLLTISVPRTEMDAFLSSYTAVGAEPRRVYQSSDLFLINYASFDAQTAAQGMDVDVLAEYLTRNGLTVRKAIFQGFSQTIPYSIRSSACPAARAHCSCSNVSRSTL